MLNVPKFRMLCPDEKVPPSTWVRIGIQCLYCIKLVHDIGMLILKQFDFYLIFNFRLYSSRHKAW